MAVRVQVERHFGHTQWATYGGHCGTQYTEGAPLTR